MVVNTSFHLSTDPNTLAPDCLVTLLPNRLIALLPYCLIPELFRIHLPNPFHAWYNVPPCRLGRLYVVNTGLVAAMRPAFEIM